MQRSIPIIRIFLNSFEKFIDIIFNKIKIISFNNLILNPQLMFKKHPLTLDDKEYNNLCSCKGAMGQRRKFVQPGGLVMENSKTPLLITEKILEY